MNIKENSFLYKFLVFTDDNGTYYINNICDLAITIMWRLLAFFIVCLLAVGFCYSTAFMFSDIQPASSWGWYGWYMAFGFFSWAAILYLGVAAAGGGTLYVLSLVYNGIKNSKLVEKLCVDVTFERAE